MELGYQRGKIQAESLHHEHLKRTGGYPIIGVNTFRNPHGDPIPDHIETRCLLWVESGLHRIVGS